MGPETVAVGAHDLAFRDFNAQRIERATPGQRVTADVEELVGSFPMIEVHDEGRIRLPAVRAWLILGRPDE
jgi:hypothetical protein